MKFQSIIKVNAPTKNRAKNGDGYSLVMVMVIVGLCAVILGGLLTYSGTAIRNASARRDSTKAFLIAQAGLEAAKSEFVNTNSMANATNSFASYYLASTTAVPTIGSSSKFNFFSSTLSTITSTSNSISYDGCTVTIPQNVSFQGGVYNVTIEGREGRGDTGPDGATLISAGDVKFVAVGTYNNARRVIRETTRFMQQTSTVFNYAYFINNLGWMYGSTISIDGDVRSNGNFNYQSNPKVNGYTFAGTGNGTPGNIIGTAASDSLATYYGRPSGRSRPGTPADPANPITSLYAPGYDGIVGSPYNPNQNPLTMPYIGTTAAYKQLAADAGGYIKYWDSSLGAYTQLNQVFGDTNFTAGVVSKGTYAKYYSPQNGKGAALYVSGDAAHPIIINGPFVVSGDLVIKGVYTGQGTIIAQRNVNIVGNLTAANPPVYPATDATPYTTFSSNVAKDMIGLVARGNIVVGNYTGTPDFASYAQPSFTSQYAVDSSDADNGYVTSTSGGTSYFNGNYTSRDKNWDGTAGVKSDGSSRKFYESTFADTVLSGVFVNRSSLNQIDGVMYCNHLMGGDIGSVTFNGTVVGRDEAFIFQNSIRFRYDERIHSSHGQNALNIFLPSNLSRPIRLTWREGN